MRNPFKKKSVENIQEKIDAAPHYDVSYKVGLNDAQVKARTESGLVNKIKTVVSKSYLEIIIKNIFTVLNILLIAIAVVMAVFVKLPERMFFIVILSLNIGISLFQDIKAKLLISRLSLISNPRAQVIRDGTKKDIMFDEVVLSDIIILKAGKTVPCDAKVVYGSVRVNESFLSGETNAVVKKENDTLYAQSYVTSGTAYAIVEKIGNANYANILQEKARSFTRPSSEILKSLQTIIRVISIGTILLGTIEIITAALTKSGLPIGGKDGIADSITSSLVAMIPSGMYLMTSISLTVGVIILARHRMLVRELYSIEMLARVNIVCVDKTGTVTTGNMAVDQLVPIGKNAKQRIELIIGQILYITKDENLTAKALRDKYATKKIEGDCASIPFDSEKKYSAASFNDHTYVMGAFGFVKVDNTKDIKAIVEENEKKGKRVLIIAEGKGNIDDNKLPNKLTAIAVLVMSETIKKDARKNIEWFRNNGVDLRVISGDSANSLRAIALEVGMDASKVISLDGLSDIEVRMAAQKYQIFARVTPEQKKLIIAELRKEGNTVAMIGDGVNDLLALKQADCSIAMANGADAAKSVAHLVSLDSNFSALPKVVEEGRKVINNLQRVCSVFLVKTMFAFVMVTIFVVLSWLNDNAHYPFKTNNMFIWEVLTIGVAPFFIALEPNKDKISGGFISNIVKEAIPAAIVQIVICLPLLMVAIYCPQVLAKAGLGLSVEKAAMTGATAMCVISFSIMSLVILLHVCMPLNKYRGAVLVGTFIVMSAVFCLDVIMNVNGYERNFILNFINLGITYKAINTYCALIGALTLVVMIPGYFFLAKGFRKLVNRKKKDEKGTIDQRDVEKVN